MEIAQSYAELILKLTRIKNVRTITNSRNGYFDSNMESLMVTDNGVTYSFTRTYDDWQKSVELMIEIKDGCADYYIKNICDSVANNIKTHLSNNSIVKDVYVEHTWMCVDLKNENEFNNHD